MLLFLSISYINNYIKVLTPSLRRNNQKGPYGTRA